MLTVADFENFVDATGSATRLPGTMLVGYAQEVRSSEVSALEAFISEDTNLLGQGGEPGPRKVRVATPSAQSGATAGLPRRVSRTHVSSLIVGYRKNG